MSDKKGTTVKSILWKAGEKAVVQVCRFVFEVVLARILIPEEFGVFTLLMTFVALSNILIEGGLNTALIQTKELDDKDPSTVFFITFAMSFLMYGIVFIIAKPLATLYQIDGFEVYLRVMGLAVFIASFNSVQNALAARGMHFKYVFKAGSLAIILSGIVGIVCANNGLGVWSLVVQYFVQLTTACIVMNVQLKWWPKVCFSVERAKTLFGFGWKLMLSSLLNRGFGEVYNLVIGAAFSTATLGVYGKGKLIPGALENGLTSVVTSVMMPVFSREQSDIEALRKDVRRCVELLTFVIAPIFFGLIVACEPLVVILLTQKWIGCVPIMQILCVGFIFQPISHINTTAFNAIGRSDVVLKLEIIKRSLGIAILCCTAFFGIEAVAAGLSLSYFLNMVLNCRQSYKLLGYTFAELAKDVLPSMGLALAMGLVVFAVGRIFTIGNYYVLLLVDILVGVAAYVLLSLLFNRRLINALLGTVKTLKRR